MHAKTRKTVALKTHNFLISINVTYSIQLLQLCKQAYHVSKLRLASTVNTFYITKAKYNLERF